MPKPLGTGARVLNQRENHVHGCYGNGQAGAEGDLV